MKYFTVAALFLLTACAEPPYTDGDLYLRAKQLCGHETTEYQSCIDYHVEEMR